MQIRSDGAKYTNGVNIQSIIQGVSGDWILDSKNAITATPRKSFSISQSRYPTPVRMVVHL
jgi:hypothetical protein